MWKETPEMVKRTSVPRYYIRDEETNELWCFDAKTFAGIGKKTLKAA